MTEPLTAAEEREKLREDWMRAGAPGTFYEWLIDRADRAIIAAKAKEPKTWKRSWRTGHRRT